MDRTIDMFVKASYIQKNNNIGGVRGEGNVTTLHIIFDDSWAGMAKSITFWNAKGENPVKVLLTNDKLVEIRESLLEFNVLIPAEPLVFEGDMIFVIDGYIDGKRARSMQDTLVVEPAMTTNEPIEPTPTQAEQLLAAIEKILPEIQAEVIKATEAAAQAEASAQAAAASAAEAEGHSTAAIAAQKAAEAAQAKAEAAQSAAETAQTNAETAQRKAEEAQRAAETAKSGAETAKTGAETAKAAAEAAQTSAEQIKAETQQIKSDTQQIKSATEAIKNEANNAKDVAVQAASNAAADATEAKTQAGNAAQSATAAAGSAVTAGEKAQEATDASVLSKSYAVGGTGTRPGEDTDNAKYYCEQAQQIVGGDFVTKVELQQTITPIASAISDLEADVTANENAISGLNTKVSANEVAISDLSAIVTANTSAISNNAKEIAAVKASVPTESEQQGWNNKVESVNGKTGKAITINMSDIKIIDDVTGKEYVFGISNGGLYYKEVTE